MIRKNANAPRTGIAMVGCGFVADLYMRSLALHPELRLVGAHDRDVERLRAFTRHHEVRAYETLDDLLGDPTVSIVLNLTNPSSHGDVTRKCLSAGKHVYSEKPLSVDLDEAHELVRSARGANLMLSSAPCNVLSESAQTVWKALRNGRIGDPRLVYAELDDGMLHRMPHRKWVSESGAAWPYRDEVEVGCTLEHAGYYVSWLAAFFGPVQRVVAFGSTRIPDKLSDPGPGEESPDFTVACLTFADGMAGRLTCGIVAPHDHRLRVVGEEGVLDVRDCWDYRCPVRLRRRLRLRRRVLLSPWAKRLPLAGRAIPAPARSGAHRMDWLRGVSDMAQAALEGRAPRLSAEFGLHVTEVALAIHSAGEDGLCRTIRSTFEPMQPMPWAL